MTNETTTETIEADSHCRYFAACENEAFTLVAHPIGPVPTCDRCLDWLARLGGKPVEILATRDR